MILSRKAARKRLKNCSRAEYDFLLHAAKLTIAQKQILDMFIADGLPICEIAYRLNFCESLVRKRLAESYDKIAFL